jgi:hypothetical protein
MVCFFGGVVVVDKQKRVGYGLWLVDPTYIHSFVLRGILFLVFQSIHSFIKIKIFNTKIRIIKRIK